MAKRLTGKQRASWIPLDYYKKRDGIGRWKLALSAFGIALPALWLGTGLSLGGAWGVRSNRIGRMRYSHGPVARVHAVWDAKCDACHDPGGSVGGEGWPTWVGTKVGDANGRCSTCHQVADHSEKIRTSEVERCASCHVDHRGRDASLVAIADAKCVACHGDLPAHAQGGKTALDPNVTSFPAGHGEFRLLRDAQPTDPGTVKFNHALHMTPGLNDAANGKPVFTLAQLDAGDRGTYGAKDAPLATPVALACASCHQPDGGGASATGGSNFRSIAFSTDCAACHKLDVSLSGGPPSAVNKARAEGTASASLYEVPHGLEPEAIRGLLRNAAIGAAMTKAEPEPEPDRPLPGRTPSALRSLPDEADVAARASHAERLLFGREKGVCTECHHYEGPNGKELAELRPGEEIRAVHIARPSTPDPASGMMIDQWFAEARFDHAAHGGVSCLECHAAADPRATRSPSRSSADVMLVGKATCAECHASEGSRTDTGATFGGAGNSCVECHRYHDPDHAKAAPIDGRTIAEFLLGAPKPALAK